MLDGTCMANSMPPCRNHDNILNKLEPQQSYCLEESHQCWNKNRPGPWANKHQSYKGENKHKQTNKEQLIKFSCNEAQPVKHRLQKLLPPTESNCFVAWPLTLQDHNNIFWSGQFNFSWLLHTLPHSAFPPVLQSTSAGGLSPSERVGRN